jgi:hypothetical protein
VMDAHWKLYAGGDPGLALPLHDARYALLPTSSRALEFLYAQNWTVAYWDPVATVMIRPLHPVANPPPPVEGDDTAVSGSVPFPDAIPALATRAVAVAEP